MSTGPDIHLIRTARSMRALASPIRQEIVDALESAGPSTIAALAQVVEKKADGLYFHVRALERVGLVRRVGTEGTGRSAAAVYDVPGRPMRLDYSGAPSSRADRLAPALDCLLRLARRDARRALSNPGARAEGKVRDLWVARVRGRVSNDDLARVNELLAECAAIIRGGSGSPDAAPVALAFALTPVGSTSHASRESRSGGKGQSQQRRTS